MKRKGREWDDAPLVRVLSVMCVRHACESCTRVHTRARVYPYNIKYKRRYFNIGRQTHERCHAALRWRTSFHSPSCTRIICSHCAQYIVRDAFSCRCISLCKVSRLTIRSHRRRPDENAVAAPALASETSLLAALGWRGAGERNAIFQTVGGFAVFLPDHREVSTTRETSVSDLNESKQRKNVLDLAMASSSECSSTATYKKHNSVD